MTKRPVGAQSEDQIGEERFFLGDFESSMVVGARWADLLHQIFLKNHIQGLLSMDQNL